MFSVLVLCSIVSGIHRDRDSEISFEMKSYNRLKLTFDELRAARNVTLVNIAPDGFCLINAVEKCLQVQCSSVATTSSQLKQHLRSELLSNWTKYGSYCVGDKSNKDFSHLVMQYLDHGVYDTEVGDIIITAVCNCLCISIIIFEQQDGYISELTCSPSESEVRDTCMIFRYGGSPEHYDALVPANNCGGSMASNKPTSAKAVKRKIAQATITSLFAKRTTLSEFLLY